MIGENPNMAEPMHDWYLQAWLAHFGKSQADMTRMLGYSKAKASDLVNGVQRYNRDVVNDIARWLLIEPYELLMSPREAAALKQLRQTAATIVAGTALATGTEG